MVYLDNAATTKPFPEVLEVMAACQEDCFGNPSSTHAIGRKARAAVEQARKDIAGLIGASSSEIIFTSGGTEADNIFLRGITEHIKQFICSPIEHPAVLNTVKDLERSGSIKVSWLQIDEHGQVSIETLAELLDKFPGALVIMMHGNNEIGNLNDLDKIGKLCELNKSLLFTDAVQTMGHYIFDLKSSNITGLAASAHKFHGPKGIGFLYLKKGTKLSSIYRGGEQEKAIRVGTENVAGIVGMAKALEICYRDIIKDQDHLRSLKRSLITALTDLIPEVEFNGTSAKPDHSMNSVLSVSFPPNPENEMLVFSLDLAGIAVSAGSACASGATKASHVLHELGHDPERAVLRCSLSRMNTKEDIEALRASLANIYGLS